MTMHKRLGNTIPMKVKKKNPAAVSLGRLGGLAGTGKAKARTSEQARKAARARWDKVNKV